ncbi:hypothetical protein QLX08_002924 [Tetragonisca angustula]|uniref:NADH dehydrogenase [ubiquinone] 1 beta subcomplex subunit 3 n=1 Tax=Tetragonisca angustula TaxID=166442 RepID=A0AAW1A916_9HYME
MGGHGHGHEPELEIPSPDIYKVENVPELKLVQDELAKLGLKDPWLRNEVWRYTAFPGTSHTLRVIRGITKGMIVGFAAFLVTLGVEHTFGITYKGEHHGDGDHHKDGDHH